MVPARPFLGNEGNHHALFGPLGDEVEQFGLRLRSDAAIAGGAVFPHGPQYLHHFVGAFVNFANPANHQAAQFAMLKSARKRGLENHRRLGIAAQIHHLLRAAVGLKENSAVQ